jgi:predicted negative regulator of RcsB-dependent stress response
MKKLTKQELRHDPFLETLEKLTAFLKTHGNKVFFGAIAVLAVVIAAVVFTSQRKQGTAEAQWKFLQAISLFSQGDTAQSIPMLRDLNTSHGNTAAGKKANYYLGIHALKNEELDLAEQRFESYLASSPGDPFLEMAAYGCLATIAMDRDQLDEAFDLYGKAETRAPYETYKAYYTYKAATAARISGRYEDAIRLLEKFDDEYKDSPFRTPARKELSFVRGAQAVERG